MREHVNFGALRIWVFAFLLIEISSRKAVPEVTSTFPGPLHNSFLFNIIKNSFEVNFDSETLEHNSPPPVRRLHQMLCTLRQSTDAVNAAAARSYIHDHNRKHALPNLQLSKRTFGRACNCGFGLKKAAKGICQHR